MEELDPVGSTVRYEMLNTYMYWATVRVVVYEAVAVGKDTRNCQG